MSTPLPVRESDLIEQNLRYAMRFFGTANGDGGITALDGAEIVYSGLDYGVFNIGFLTGKITSARDLASTVAACGRAFHQHGVRWSFWLCDDLLDAATRRRSRDIFHDAGMRPISQAPGMFASALAPPVRPLPEIECRPVTDSFTRAGFTELTTVCFDIPLSVASAIYSPGQAWQGEYQGFIGMVDGRVVSIVALVRAAGSLGIYSLGTLPQFRRRGYGEALLRAAVARLHGNEPLVLESTEAGYPLYKRLGFRDLTRFTVYLTR
jgi:ribosomal protein S18 acetylase RimI-like enzyme